MKAFTRICIFLNLLCAVAQETLGQQDPMYTQYMYNTQMVNPAYAGSREALTVTALTRVQWAGIAGNPTTQTITVHSPLVSNHFGIGVALNRDAIGKSVMSTGQLDFAFRFSTGKRSQLSMGMKGGFTLLSENLAELTLRNQNDPAFIANTTRGIVPNVGTGIYYQREKFYLGLSVPEILQGAIRPTLMQGVVWKPGLKQRHYYLIAGAIFELQDRIDLKPTIMVKQTFNAPLQIDATARVIFYDKLIAGIMYRHAADVGLLVGFNFTEQFMFGYSFDWSLPNANRGFNYGSHEFALRYDFLYRNSRGVRSSRYF